MNENEKAATAEEIIEMARKRIARICVEIAQLQRERVRLLGVVPKPPRKNDIVLAAVLEASAGGREFSPGEIARQIVCPTACVRYVAARAGGFSVGYGRWVIPGNAGQSTTGGN